jgi:hypothetical protein
MITLNFSQQWPRPVSPIELKFGAVIVVEEKELAAFIPVSWQPFQDLNTSKSLVFNNKNESLALSKTTIYESQITLSNQSIYRFNSKGLLEQSNNLQWRTNSDLAMTGYTLPFSTLDLENNLVSFYWMVNKKLQFQSLGLSWKNFKEIGVEILDSWIVNPDFVVKDIVIHYGPSDKQWLCVWKNHPTPGLVLLPFKNGKTPTSSLINLNFSQPEKICFWVDGGGLLRGYDDFPVINRKVAIEPQLQSSYVMQPKITCVRVKDDLDILITSFNYQTSRSQFAATCSVKFCSRIDFERSLNELLKITVNGYDFYTFIEQTNISKKFNSQSYSANGRSRFSELAAPNVRAKNYTNQTARTLVGLMSDILQNSGWTINSKIIDYAVPALAFSYSNKTPAEALAICAKSIGAMLNINDNTKTIEVLPQWPVMPWTTDNATCDVIINDSVILEHNTIKKINAQSNVVMVRGEQQGVACKIKRSETLADLYASDVTDALITDNQAAIQRGSCELANSGNKEQSTIRTKIMPDLPPLLPGILIGIRYGADIYKATCDSLSINASISNDGKITVNQTVTVLKSVA